MKGPTRIRRRVSVPAGRAVLRTVLSLGALLAVSNLLLAAAPLSALAQMKQGNVKLSLSGPEGTSYEGHCHITRMDGDEELELSGKTPKELSFEAEALKCTLRSDGRLTVEARKGDGNISRTSTSGGTVTFSIR